METLIAIVGPTAVGKTAAARALAEKIPMEIINADSRQVYRGMNIGTAKPPPEERARIPHHLVDILDPEEEFSLADFLERANNAIEEIRGRKRFPVLVGGTGQYIWGLLENWQVPAVAPDLEFRSRLEQWAERNGRLALHNHLKTVDSMAAAEIHPRNLRRIIRALEVCHQTGTPFSEQRGKGGLLPNLLIIGLTLDRQVLYQRVNTRVDEMLSRGWLDEVMDLSNQGYGPELPSMSSVGYQQIYLYMRKELPWQTVVEQIKIETHRLVRRQYNWFRLKDSRICWMDASSRIAEEIVELL